MLSTKPAKKKFKVSNKYFTFLNILPSVANKYRYKLLSSTFDIPLLSFDAYSTVSCCTITNFFAKYLFLIH
jgi:hypothetical protein